jgi:hypothetical protein
LVVYRYPFLRKLAMEAHWETNGPSVLVTFRVSRAGRTLFRRTRRYTSLLPMETDYAFMDWRNAGRHRVKRGRKVRVTVSVDVGDDRTRGRNGTLSR